MPIAHEQQFIFIHIPKTAGYAISRAFERGSLRFDFTASGLLERFGRHPDMPELVREFRRFFPLNSISGFNEQHLPATLLRQLVTPEVWSSYYKFAFVRNPWALTVSTFHYFRQYLMHAHVRAVEPDLVDIIERVDFAGFIREYTLNASDQTGFFADSAGDLLIDFVGRVESIEDDFAALCRRFSIATTLQVENTSAHEHYRDYYDTRTRELVRQHFERDIRRFGYAFQAPRGPVG